PSQDPVRDAWRECTQDLGVALGGAVSLDEFLDDHPEPETDALSRFRAEGCETFDVPQRLVAPARTVQAREVHHGIARLHEGTPGDLVAWLSGRQVLEQQHEARPAVGDDRAVTV